PSVSITADERFSPGLSAAAHPPAPAGYLIGEHESPTVPVVSGAIGDLIGLAREHGIPHGPERLSQALYLSAHTSPLFPGWVQGVGVVDAGAAWTLLQRLAELDRRDGSAVHFDIASADGTPFLANAGPHPMVRTPGEIVRGTL